MTRTRLSPSSLVVGVDTHKSDHVAVALDGMGVPVGAAFAFPASRAGYVQLVEWADALGDVHIYGVEGCGSYGAGLARHLRRHGRRVVEVTRPVRRGQRRLSGKSDAIDADHAARTALAGLGTATPKLADGQVESMRMLKIARDSAVKARSAVMITLKACSLRSPLTFASDWSRSAIRSSSLTAVICQSMATMATR